MRSDLASKNGLGREILIQADAMSGDVIDALTAMDRAANAAHAEQREKEMENARALQKTRR